MLPSDLPHYSRFLADYFSTNYISDGIVAGICILILSFAIFKTTNKHDVRSSSLIVIVGVSASIWVFVLSSVVFCFALFHEYYFAPAQAIFTAASVALITCIAVGPFLFYVLRERVMEEIYPFFSIDEKLSLAAEKQAHITELFQGLISKAGISNVHLSILPDESKLPPSAALDWQGQKIVAIFESKLELLDENELETVLAHEIGHLAQNDSIKKAIVTAYKFAFPFDPLSRLVEAALYRERELSADEYSAKLTHKPAFLASALLKIYESGNVSRKLSSSPAVSSLIGGKDWGLLSKQPSLAERIQKLLEMDKAAQS